MTKLYNFTAKARVYGIADDIGELVTITAAVEAGSKAAAEAYIPEIVVDSADEKGLVDFPIQRATIERVTWQ